MDRIELTYTDADGRKVGIKRSFSIDVDYGPDGSNDFEVALAEGDSLPMHGYAYVDGTEYGGIVDRRGFDTTGDAPVSRWGGRSWHGILSHSVVMPTGEHYTMSGDANAAIGELIAAQGLDGVFRAAPYKSGFTLNHQVDRFADAYSAILDALSGVGARLSIRRAGSLTELSAVPAVTEYRYDGSALLNTRPVNHLVCGGGGEGADRLVVHLYADESGNVSRTQTLFGVDEVAEFYDYTSADEAKLVEDGTKRLTEHYADRMESDVQEPEGPDLNVGDSVALTNHASGFTQTEVVSEVTATISSDGGIAVSYTLGG